MLNEREKPRSRTTTLLIELKGDGKTVYEAILVNETAHDDPTKFIIKEKRRLRKRLNNLRIIPTDRGKRETRDIRNSNNKLIRKEQLVEKLSVLKGERLQPIRLIKKGNKIKTLELASFTQKERERQERWWAFVNRENLMSKIEKVVKDVPGGDTPGGLEVLYELFNIRHKMKNGLLKEVNQAKIDFIKLQEKVDEIPDEHDILLTPLFFKIADEFSN